jgi:hypothetical protein
MKKKTAMLVIVGIVLIVAGVFGANQIVLQSPMNQVLTSDPRNHGVDVSVHYGSFINPRVLVFDIQNVAGTNSEADVFRVFLQLADKMQSTSFGEVDLACKGQTKFFIRGAYFRQLGKEYPWQNPVYTTRTFPEHVMNPGGSPAYSSWEGGFLGVDLHQIQDFNDLHSKWWKSELAAN